MQPNSATLGAATVLMEGTHSPLVCTLGISRIHRGQRHLVHTNPRTLQVGSAVRHLALELALCSSLDRRSLVALLHPSLLALPHRCLFMQRRLSLLEDLQRSLFKLLHHTEQQHSQWNGHRKLEKASSCGPHH